VEKLVESVIINFVSVIKVITHLE